VCLCKRRQHGEESDGLHGDKAGEELVGCGVWVEICVEKGGVVFIS
jgi:hypothetical protein